MIQDGDEDILGQHDRMIKLSKQISIAIARWQSEDAASNSNLMVVMKHFTLTPIGGNSSIVMQIVIDKTNGWLNVYETVFKSLTPYVRDNDIDFI